MEGKKQISENREMHKMITAPFRITKLMTRRIKRRFPKSPGNISSCDTQMSWKSPLTRQRPRKKQIILLNESTGYMKNYIGVIGALASSNRNVARLSTETKGNLKAFLVNLFEWFDAAT